MAVASAAVARVSGFFYSHEGQWRDLASGSPVDASIARELEQSFGAAGSWHRRKSSSEVHFKIAEYNAIAVIQFNARPSSQKLQAFWKAFQLEVDNARNEFLASHDGITECLNKTAIDKRLLELAKGITAALIPASVTPTSISVAGTAATNVFNLSMDLDHFKSVNDNFGHLYGDLVLRAFSWRIDAACEEWLSQFAAGTVQLFLARPGGEEFQAVVAGPVSEGQVLELAESIRAKVAGEPLPSRSEFEVLSADGRSEVDHLPHDSERKVTVSVGVSALGATSKEKEKGAVATMLRQSDLALYSAKGGGRNAVRSFSDILKKYSRAVATHPDTELISIDIGSEAGVRLGQEFLAYPPDFVGNIPFFSGEGRSRKRLGFYPRYAIARIAVVDVQPEVSFCKVEQRLIDGVSKVPSGSVLEAIPLGSISHLISKPGKSMRRLAGSVDDVRAFIRGLEAQARVPTAAVFLKGLHDLASARGLMAANETLANVFEILIDCLGARSQVAMVGDDGFVIAPSTEGYDAFVALLNEALIRARESLPEGLDINAGAFNPAAFDSVSPENGVELSILASTSNSSNEVATFDIRSAELALYQYRVDRKFETGRADLQKLFDIGFHDDRLFAQGALLEHSAPDGNLELAESYMIEAVKLNSDQPFHRFNLATIRSRRRDYEGAVSTFRQAFAAVQDHERFAPYIGIFAEALVNLAEKGGSVSLEEVERELTRAESMPSKPVIVSPARLSALRDRYEKLVVSSGRKEDEAR